MHDEPNEGTPVVGLDQEPPILPTDETSYVDLFKQDFQELADIVEVYIPVEGYERSGLAVKYGMPENGKVLDNLGRKVMQEVKDGYYRNLNISLDIMIHLCQGLYVRPQETRNTNGNNEYYMLDPQNTGQPVQFDERLAELLPGGSDLRGAREVVKKLFDNNEMAIIRHAEKLQRWLQNKKADLNLEFWQNPGEV